ncbi:hypothetical protein CRYUN_Cryun17cG0011400 [Craigia yunnanensis]
MYACVCKSWRSVAIAFKQEFMTSQGPLVFLMSTNARKYCYFYNIFDKRLYRAALPHLPGNKCLGFTRGYLLLRESKLTKKKTNIWPVNPYTRHEIKFPRPPKRSGDVNWTVFEYSEDPRMIIDVAVFKGKIYVSTSHGEIGTLNLNSDPMVTFLHVKSVSASRDDLHLVASHEELYIAHFRPAEGFIKTHKLDFERMKWEKVKLKGEVLFLGDMKYCGLSSPTPSRRRFLKHLNRVCYLGDGHILVGYMARYVAGRLNKLMRATRKDGKPNIFISSPLRYFLHLSSSVDSVYED